MQQRERSGQRRLAVSAGEQQHDGLHDATAGGVARPVDAPDDPFLPRVELEGVTGERRLRVLQAAQELDGLRAATERVGNVAAVVNPAWEGALRHVMPKGDVSSASSARTDGRERDTGVRPSSAASSRARVMASD